MPRRCARRHKDAIGKRVAAHKECIKTVVDSASGVSSLRSPDHDAVPARWRRTLPSTPFRDRSIGSSGSSVHPLLAVAGALGAVGVAMGLAHRLTTVLPPAYAVLVFLVAVLAAASFLGLWSGLLAAAASFFAFNFFFVEPTFTFAVDDPREVFALGVFLVAAILTGSLAGRLRETADAARFRADTLAMLQAFAEKVSATTDPSEVRALVARHVADRIGGQAMVVGRRGGDAEGWPEQVTATAEEARAIAAAFDGGDAAPRRAGRFLFRPLTTADGVVAVVGLAMDTAPATGFDEEEGLSALLEQAAVALERARLTEESAEAWAAAERERLRSALLSSISHDLRTPLATILGSVTSLRQLGDRMDPEDRADLLAAIEEETDRLSRFVADLLLMTRLEAGLDVCREEIDVGDVVAAAAANLRRVHGGHPLRATRPSTPVTVCGDALLLGQVLFNLGDNAAKASPKGAEIDLIAEADAGQVRITVADRGRGLTGEEIRRLFEVGGTGSVVAPEAGWGGGLGLVIARRVVAAMGGTITAESRTEQWPGTRITLRLPLAATQNVTEPEGDEA